MRPNAGGGPDADRPGSPAPAETLYESEHTRITRIFLGPDGTEPVIRKEPLGPDAHVRQRRELAILERLTGVAGVCQLAPVSQRLGSILLADDGGVPLRRTALPWAADDVARLGAELARTVAAIHQRGVIHGEINPDNVLLAAGPNPPSLVDFDHATTVDGHGPEGPPHPGARTIVPYLAPEQTGRTGRRVDERTDLYALGATLYELATGQPPFTSTDPLRLSHDQLAQVPTAPAQLNPAVPAGLSEVIMRLLEKEPDRRYQTAEGLGYDLTELFGPNPLPPPRTGPGLGSRDFPVRLRPPSRLVGREAEVDVLTNAFLDALDGRCRSVLVSGPAGIGKTSLINELRPLVTANGGRFVTGKFDQHRQDQEFDAVRQAYRALGRLLLAEPEEQVAELRRRILRTLGHNAGLVAAVLPEFEPLLQIEGDASIDDQRGTQARLAQVAVDLLRAVVTPQRPLVMVVDDLQWGQRTPLGLFDAILTGSGVDGFLLVGAYRDGEVAVDHPLRALRSRWESLGVAPRQLALANLPTTNLAALLADVLRLDPGRAAELASVIEPRTQGNPFDTVELLNALRRDGALRQENDGWHWNVATLRHYLDSADTADPLAARTAALPASTRAVLERMACLGGQADTALIRAATGIEPAQLRPRLEPAVHDGLLLVEPGEPEAFRFQHDRVQESLVDSIEPGRRAALRLELARNLGRHPEFVAVAAEQYLFVIDQVRDPAERRGLVDLLRSAADQAALMCYQAAVERLLSAGIQLYDAPDPAPLIEMETGRLGALYSLGRLGEADEIFGRIDRLSTDPGQRTDAVLVQVSSLTNRGRLEEALRLGLEQLGHLGLAVPSPDRLDGEVERRLDLLYRWVEESSPADERSRPESRDPHLLATAALINRIMATAFFGDRRVMNWLALEAIALWVRHGPTSALVGPVGHVAFTGISLRQDYRIGHQALRLALAAAEANRYQLATAHARFLYGVGTGHWFDSLEDNVRLVQRAREDLVQGGDLQNGCYSYYIPVHQFLEYAPSLDTYAVEVESAVTFAVRTGNTMAALAYGAYRALVRDLRGEPEPPGTGEAWMLARGESPVGDPNTVANVHLTRALAAALLGDADGLARHIGAATPLLPFLDGSYPTVLAYLLRALALCHRLRTGAGDEREELLVELDAAIDWLAGRAQDAPGNFHHLLLLAQAERAWAVGEFRAASAAYDAAQREVVGRHRPWHEAFILERSARFDLASGLEHTGHRLLADARHGYEAWGATAKVDALDRDNPLLWNRTGAAARATDAGASPRPSTVTSSIDLLGILAASRALSSENTLSGLQGRVTDVLSAMTGATTIHIALWNEDTQSWTLSVNGATEQIGPDSQLLLPLTAVRYAERTREPLVVADATRDDRFARDPYLAGLDRCSLLVVPILNRGQPQALLLLENRLIRSAFSPDHLDGVMLIAGQLAVSLDNARIYASLERLVAERTQALAVANERLERLSVTDPLTGLANRRRLEDVLDAQWRQADRSGQPIGVAMVDVDHFKPYNDHYGHPAGDECLRRIATELDRHRRDTDLVARYGGEEFAVVLPNTDLTAARGVAERLRAAVEALGQPHPLAADEVVTVSIGVAALDPAGPNHPARDDLVSAADDALYEAKRDGRNRVRPTLPATLGAPT